MKYSVKLSQIVIDDFLGFCVSRLHLGKGSLRNIRADFCYLRHWLDVREVTKENIEQFFLEKNTLSHSYLNKFIHVIRYLDQYVKERRMGDFSFIWQFKSFSIIRPPFEVLDNIQIEALYATTLPYGVFHGKDRTDELNFLHTTIIMFLSQTGCRFGELQDLLVKDIDPSGKVIFRETKNGTYRYNFIYEPLLSRVMTIIANKKPHEVVFTNSKGSPIIGNDFNQDLKKRCHQTGIIPAWKEIHTHTFRHSFIVELLGQGVPMALVAAWVGHKDIQSTNYYYKSLDTHLRDAISHHRIIRQNITPTALIKQMQEVFDGYHLESDQRFGYKMEKGDSSFTLTVFVK